LHNKFQKIPPWITVYWVFFLDSGIGREGMEGKEKDRNDRERKGMDG